MAKYDMLKVPIALIDFEHPGIMFKDSIGKDDIVAHKRWQNLSRTHDVLTFSIQGSTVVFLFEENRNVEPQEIENVKPKSKSFFKK